jgi:1-acyl-sn-glycerol-3-phosphate acyltransferase
VLFDLFALGLFGGFFIVPLYALIQLRSAPEQRARIIAANNILNALFMVCRRAGGGRAARRWAFDSGAVRRRRAVQCGGGGLHLQPGARVHAALHCLAADHSVYRLRQNGLENIPEEGAAVLVCNHVSFVDPIVIAAASRRPIRFVMDYRIYRTPLISFVFRHMHAIPIAPARDDAAMMEAAFEEVASALEAGELVAIFPGRADHRQRRAVSLPAGRAAHRRRTPVPVIPMALQGLWGSFFSRKDGPAMSKPLRRGLFSKIALVGRLAGGARGGDSRASAGDCRRLRGER